MPVSLSSSTGWMLQGAAAAVLGLAIARQIVKLHGGAIEARSAKDMIEFTVKLPLS